LEEVWRKPFQRCLQILKGSAKGKFMTNQKVITRKHRDPEFKRDAAKMVVEGGRKASEVARDVGVTAQTVASWARLYVAEKSVPKLSSSELQLKAAMEENRKLKVQVEFLKKTMAYFVELPK
jgi:transposase